MMCWSLVVLLVAQVVAEGNGSMWWAPVVSVAFVVGIVVASLLWRRDIKKQTALPAKSEHRKFPFKKVDSALSGFELSVYRTLQHEVGAEYVVFPKVKLQQIVALSRKSKREIFYSNLLTTRHVDFLLCDKDKIAPFLAIQVLTTGVETDDDELTAHVVRSADLPCLQLPEKKSFAPQELLTLLRDAIKDRRKTTMANVYPDMRKKI